MLVSVFERFNGKTPSRDVCDDIARAFTRSPVRDPTRRALAPGPDDERAKGAAPPVAAAREDFAGSSSAPATASPSRVLLPDPAEPLRSAVPAESADGLPLASSPFRGAAWRDAARARARLSARGREDGEPRGSFGGSFGGGEAGALDPPVSDPPTRAEAHPDEGLAFFAPAEAPEEVWADAVADATGESADGSSRGDETKSLLSRVLNPRLDAERRGGASRTPSRLDAFVGSASRLERLERALDVAAWQPVGTSLYVGERAETATPPRTRRVSSPSPPPPPADPAPAAPYLPETPGVLASEDNGVERIASERRGASFFPRPEPDDETLNPAWSGSERGAGESFASGAAGAARDEAPEFGGGALSTSFRGAARGAVVDDDRARLGFAGLPLAAALAPSPAYAPGVSLEDLVREKDDDLSAALALGARTGRWLPLAAAGGGGPEPGTAAPSSAAQAAMVASAAEELGDGEAHPVTWKQIKTWFENRRMTQKRIKEGIARPPRRNNNAHPAPEPEPDATDAAVAKGEANRRGKPPRVPASKPRATPAEKLFAKASASRSAKSPEPAFVATARGADAARDPPPARRSLDETRRDAAARPGAKRARTDANASKTSLGLPARRSLDLDRASLDAAAAAAAAAEDLHACDTAWGEPSSALTREMSWADIHEALAGAERARRSAP